MLEWQTESNLFTVRIRGKQWYWIYKFEIKTLLNVLNVPKNIGHNYWVLFSNSGLTYSEDYINILQLKNNNKWLNEYLQNYIKKNIDLKKLKFNFLQNSQKIKENNILVVDQAQPFTQNKPLIINNAISNKGQKVIGGHMGALKGVKGGFVDNFFIEKSKLYLTKNIKKNTLNYNQFNQTSLSTLSFKFDDTNRYQRYNYFSKVHPLKINFLKNNFLLNFNNNNNVGVEKNMPDNIYLVIKQKRFTPVRKLELYKNKSLVLNNHSFLELISFDKNKTKSIFKGLKNKPQDFSNIYYKRLLRTKRVLVLPTNINITLITNSFDVVHSWYIPGLGIKLDCVPGRSTHHTLNIDHAGFYYGQCAEICGRHHHHMPIRVCALPFEHFLIWWYHYGLPYFNSVGVTRKVSIKSGIRQFNW